MTFGKFAATFFLILFLIPVAAFAQPRHDTLFINHPGEYEINRHLFIYKTNSRQTPTFVYDSVLPKEFTRLFPNTTYNNTGSLIMHYWLVVTLKNNLPHNEVFYYCLNAPGLNLVTAYAKTGTNAFAEVGKSGMMVPFALKQNNSYDTEFRFLIEKKQSLTILLDIANPNGTNAFFIPDLNDGMTYNSKRNYNNTLIGIISGIMILTFLLNLFYAVSLKEKIHYLYAIYVFCLLLDIYILEGKIESYISNYAFSDMLARVNPAIILILMSRIMQWFLNQKRNNSYFKTAVDAGIIVSILSALCHVAVYVFTLGPVVTNLLQIINCIGLPFQLALIVLSAIEKALQGKRRALVYLAATTWLLYGIFQIIFAFLGFNTLDFFRHRPLNIETGMVIEAIVVFLAIVYRFNLLKKERENLLIEVAAQKQSLVERIIAAEEGERKRIAADLHDDVGATLNRLNLHISNIPQKWQESPEIKKYHDEGMKFSNKAMADVRTIAHNMRPKDFKETGLFTILENRVYELNQVTNINFSLITEGNDKILNEIIAVVAYRIVSELLTNIVKHSVASEAVIQVLSEERGLQIMAEDDGIGFDQKSAKAGIGLQNIKGRIDSFKGTLQIDTGAQGTHIIIHLPINNQPTNNE